MRSPLAQPWQPRFVKSKLGVCISSALALLLLTNIWIHHQASQINTTGHSLIGLSRSSHGYDGGQSLSGNNRSVSRTGAMGNQRQAHGSKPNSVASQYLAGIQRRPTPPHRNAGMIDLKSHLRSSSKSPVRIWMPSFPGSGSDLVLRLIRGAIGLDLEDVNDVHDDCARRGVILCNTHFPIDGVGNPRNFHRPSSTSVMLLIRNPARAIPSGHNGLWEKDHDLPQRSEKMPHAYWRANREEIIRRGVFSIDHWNILLDFWNSGMFSVGLIVSFEDLINPQTGPRTLIDMITFTLKQNQIDPELFRNELQYETIVSKYWNEIVQGKASPGHSQRKGPPSIQRHSARDSYTPCYTANQKSEMIITIRDALNQHGSKSASLRRILEQYIHEIETDIPTDTEEGIDWSLKRNATQIEEKKAHPKPRRLPQPFQLRKKGFLDFSKYLHAANKST